MRRTAQLLRSLLSVLITIVSQGTQFLWLAVSSRAELSAEVLFLRKQLAFYQEHQVQPRKLNDAARFSLVLWSQLCNWRAALMIVKPETVPTENSPQPMADVILSGEPRNSSSLRLCLSPVARQNPR